MKQRDIELVEQYAQNLDNAIDGCTLALEDDPDNQDAKDDLHMFVLVQTVLMNAIRDMKV